MAKNKVRSIEYLNKYSVPNSSIGFRIDVNSVFDGYKLSEDKN